MSKEIALPLNGTPIIIKDWQEAHNAHHINVACMWQVCDWCRKMNKYRLAQDNGDVLFRFNVSVYQLINVDKILKTGKFTLDTTAEWCPTIGASFIHAVACFENCGIDCASLLYDFGHTIEHEMKSPNKIYEETLYMIPHITRQVLYKSMNRRVRFNEEELKKYVVPYLSNLILLNRKHREYYKFSDSLLLAMDSIANHELKEH